MREEDYVLAYLAFVIYELKAPEQAQKYLLRDVKTQILRGMARNLSF